jgi:hypothetical protein
VPGADPLAAHPDLLADVSALNLTRERALEIVRLRSQGKAAEQVTAQQQEVQEFTKTVQAAAVTMETALKARATEPGHESKLKSIHAYFSDPAKMQAFVTTYQPEQWQPALMLMYDNMGVQAPVAAPPAGPQPLRPNNVRTGAPVRNGPVTAEGAVADAFKLVHAWKVASCRGRVRKRHAGDDHQSRKSGSPPTGQHPRMPQSIRCDGKRAELQPLCIGGIHAHLRWRSRHRLQSPRWTTSCATRRSTRSAPSTRC